jgi:hypothetical protein
MEAYQEVLAAILVGVTLATHVIGEQAVTGPEQVTIPTRRRDLEFSLKHDHEYSLKPRMEALCGLRVEQLDDVYRRPLYIGQAHHPGSTFINFWRARDAEMGEVRLSIVVRVYSYQGRRHD